MERALIGSLQIKNGDNAFWETNKDKILKSGQLGFNKDTHELKIGEATTWNDSILINSKSIIATATPTTQTIGQVGQHLLAIIGEEAIEYVCTAADEITPAYTWEVVGGGAVAEAKDIKYDNSVSGLNQITIQSAIDNIISGVQGSMQNPIYVPNGTDFNNLKTIGYYMNGAISDCTNMINTPVKTAFNMEVINLDGGSVVQKWMNFTGNIMYTRAFFSWSNSWTDWQLKVSGSSSIDYALALMNGWTPYYHSNRIPVFYKQNDIVYVAGLMRYGTQTPGTVIAVLPEGYRPYENLIFLTQCAGGYVRIDVSPSGNIIIRETNSGGVPNTFCSLSGISFRTGS